MALVPFDQLDGKIWFDGELVNWADAKIHVLSHGLHYGSVVFEGERVYAGKIFKSREHTERLFRSAEMLGMTMPMDVDALESLKKETAAVQGLDEAYVRVVAWRGSEQMGVSAQQTKTHVACAVWAWPSYFPMEARLKGIKLKTSRWKRPSPETIPCHAKAAGLYMICTMSKHEAEAQGYEDALMHDYRGYIAEATGANIFFQDGRDLHTPTPDCFLDGITRRTVIALAREHGLNIIERHIKPEELSQFTGCFLTGTAAEVTPVSQIDDYRFTVSEDIQHLMQSYETLVRS
ncbi:MAG: branched-chain amino acid aminotransferase [Alphaproteobacteria bacterium]|jgi:branched-chain amino acid aminotransferase|nr:branched-chain amino acid aminotransferase [Alphaproteobacteria bacterium]